MINKKISIGEKEEKERTKKRNYFSTCHSGSKFQSFLRQCFTRIVKYVITLFDVMLCHVILCYVMLCDVMSCYVM